MAQTSWGFDGTINEAQWSEMAGLLGNGYVAADSASCVVTAVPGARSVSVSAGTLYGDGIVTVLDDAETVAMTTPVNGQWYVIALRRTWATNSTALVAIAGATTTTSTPTAPPSTLPTLNADPGVLTDQPIAWGWCNSANTTVVVYDMRQFPVRRMPLTVANNVVRDGIFQTPTQGQQVWRNDLGAVETYYGAYNAISNPGGRDSAGWYTETRQANFQPISPASIVVASGSGSANALGRVTVSGASVVSFNNVFSSKFKFYKIVGSNLIGSTDIYLNLRLRSSGTDLNTGYYQNGMQLIGTSFAVYNEAATSVVSTGFLGSNDASTFVLDAINPAVANRTSFISNMLGWTFGNTLFNRRNLAFHDGTGSYDGFSLIASSGTFSGSFTIEGYN